MAPPFVGTAVNVTGVIWQTLAPGFAEILTDGVTDAVTTIAIVLDVAVAGLPHASDDVITTVTTSPFDKPLLEYVLLFVPTLLLFTLH